MAHRSYNYQGQDLEGVSGIFNTQTDLDRVLNELERMGLSKNVSVLMSEHTRGIFDDSIGNYSGGTEVFEHTSKLPEGAVTGGLTGGILGAVIGGLTLIGSVILPGSGLLVAGPLVGILTGGAIGTAAGGLVGALVGAGIPETEAKYYQESLQKHGNVLVVAHVPHEMVNEVRSLFKRCGAESVRVV